MTQELQKIFQNAAEHLARDIAFKMVMEEDFVVSVDSTMIEPFVIAIDAGYPPILRIDMNYISQTVLLSDEKERTKFNKVFKRKLALAISKIPRQYRTLSQNPLGASIALQSDSRKFHKTNDPDKIHFSIPHNQIEVTETYTVSVRELTTGHIVTLSGDNPSLLRNKAIAQLTSIVSDSIHFKLPEVPETPEPVTIQISNHTEDDIIKYDY